MDKKTALALSRDPLARMMAARPEGLVALFAARLVQEDSPKDLTGESFYPAAHLRGLYKAAGREAPSSIKQSRKQAIAVAHHDVYEVFLAAAARIDPHLRDGYIAKAQRHPHVIVHVVDDPALEGLIASIMQNDMQYKTTLTEAGEKTVPALTRRQARNHAAWQVIQDFAREHRRGTELDPDYHLVTDDKYLFVRCSAEFAEELWKFKPPGFGGYGYAPPPHTRPDQTPGLK